MASSVNERNQEAEAFEGQEVGSASYLNRHNTEMFESGRSFSGNERHKVWLNNGDATFSDLSDLSGADSPNDGRGVIAADFDDDGDVDIFVHCLQRERHELYRNDLGTAAGFIKVRLRATRSQYEAVGATVIATVGGRSTAQVLSRGAGFVSAQAPELVFGLGGAEAARLAVRWPSGELEDFGRVGRDHRVLLVEGAGAPEAVEGHPTSLPNPLPRGLRVTVGQKLPRLAVLDADGEEAVLDPAKLSGGKPLYLNLWASYCGSCVKELPDLEALYQGVETRVVALSMDAPTDLHEAHALFERRGATFPAYYLGAKEDGRAEPVAAVIDIERLPIPTTLVVGPDGTLEAIISGPIESQ